MVTLRSVWTNRPARIILLWQLAVTAAAIALAAIFSGFHGALSAGLGGAVSMAAGVVFALLAIERRGSTAGDVLVTAFKAEGAKILFMVAALWLVMAAYKNVVAVVFIGTFIATVLVQSMAFFVGAKRH